MSVLIRNGRIITASDDYVADIYVDQNLIQQIGPKLPVEADTQIDATDRLVLPGGIDPHTHLDMPYRDTTSADDFASGTRAAALGGTTTILDFPTQAKGQSLLQALDLWHQKARGKACIDYGFHLIISDFGPEHEDQLRQILLERGVSSLKLFMAYAALMLDDGALYRVMRQAGQLGAVVMMHAENGLVIEQLVRQAVARGESSPAAHARTRPPAMEAEAVARAIALAELAGVRLYVAHVSCAQALQEIRRARARGAQVLGETCPQYLVLDESCYERPDFEGAKWVMTPPLRTPADHQSLWQGLASGCLQTVGSDHCPFNFATQKQAGRNDFRMIPNGAPGIENRMSLIYSAGVAQSRLSLQRFVEVTSTNAARIFGLFPRKGTIAVGSDADLVIFDPARQLTISASNPLTHHMRVDYSAYEGIAVQGYVETVLARGQVICHQGRFLGRPGAGQFLSRTPRPPA